MTMIKSAMKNSTTLLRNEKLEYLKLLEIKEKRIRNNPLKYARQHQKQKEASKEDKIIRALFWGNRVGKTEWGAQEVVKVILGEHPFIPTGEVWSFCPSFDEQKDTTQKKILKYLPEDRIDKERSTTLRKGIYKEIAVKRGGKITFKSYEQGREKAQGAGKVLIWFDEEPPHDIWEECFVRQEAGITLRIILTMTAVKGMTWVYDEIYLNTDNPDIFISTAGWDDNPWLTEEQKEVMGRGLSPQTLKVRREGKFVARVGLVCPWFDREHNLFDIEDLPERRLPYGDDYFCIDFGFSAECAGMWVRVDRSQNLWFYDGFYRTGLTTPDIVDLIRQKEVGRARVKRIGDSAQAGDLEEIRRAGIPIIGVKKVAGKQEYWDEYRASLLEQYGRRQELTGRPKLFIARSLVDEDEYGNLFNFFVKELENLRWEELKVNSERKHVPRWGKQKKHAVDAASYLLVELFRPALMESIPKKKRRRERSKTNVFR